MDSDPHLTPPVLLLAPPTVAPGDDAVVMLAEMATVLGLGPVVPGLVLAASSSL